MHERGAVHLPNLFRNWQMGGGGTIFDFIDYLVTKGGRVGTYVHYSIYINNRPMHVKIHSSTIDSIISILQGHSRYFDGKGRMPRADDLIKAGKITALDLSRADPLVSKLMIQHYLHEIRDYQKLILEMKGKEGSTNVLLGIDEAHQWFKRYTANALNKVVETELETHIKLSRSLGIATILNSQLGSELHPAATRLSTVKILLRSERSELKALRLSLTDEELNTIESFRPGMAQLRDNYKINVPLYVKIPMCPAEVKGQT